MVFSTSGRLLSLVGLGATFTQSSTNGASFPYYGGDLCVSPLQGECGTLYTHTNTGKGAVASVWEMTFPRGVLGASDVGVMYLSNRLTPGVQCDGVGTPGCEARMIGANISLISPAGNVPYLFQNLSASAFQTFRVRNVTAPIFPDPSSPLQVNETALRLMTRYVVIRFNTAATACLHFREVMVLDSTYTNVALQKNTSGSAPFDAARFPYR